ncbi:MAG: hypothetical protein WA747_04775 [Steroidobacteraceae bacterium]
MAGYSGTPLAKKLGIRAGARLFLHAPPANYAKLVAPLPAGVRTVPHLDADTDLAHLFASRRAELRAMLGRLRRAMRDDAVIWLSWPKRASGVATDITEDVVRELALPLRLVDIKVCAVDDTWSGLKLVVRKAARAVPGRKRHA